MSGNERPKRIPSSLLFRALADAGIIRSEDFCRRVVIDVQVGEAVKVYTERFGDERLLGVALTLNGIEVRGTGEG